MSGADPVVRRRREPPSLRRASVVSTDRLTSNMTRVVLVGDDLGAIVAPDPAGSVRLLVPTPGCKELVIPLWNGNEFLLPDGTRPALRTFTPLTIARSASELALDVVVHEGGVVSNWVQRAVSGDPVALSGPGRGYEIDSTAREFLLVGDAAALPAVSQLIETLPVSARIIVHLEIPHGHAPLELPSRANASITWHGLPAGGVPGSTLVGAVQNEAVGRERRIWAAGEAAAMQAIRRHLFEERGLARSLATIRGYWKLR